MAKTYIHEDVTYGARGRRWGFVTPRYSYHTPIMPGGRETADKIARIIAGGVKRTDGSDIDNLARANMHMVFHNAAKAQSRLVEH